MAWMMKTLHQLENHLFCLVCMSRKLENKMIKVNNLPYDIKKDVSILCIFTILKNSNKRCLEDIARKQEEIRFKIQMEAAIEAALDAAMEAEVAAAMEAAIEAAMGADEDAEVSDIEFSDDDDEETGEEEEEAAAAGEGEEEEQQQEEQEGEVDDNEN